jgi:hypothetical protein
LGIELVRRSPAGFALKKGILMTAITVSLPADVVERIDQLRELELLSRSNWLRREIVLAVRESVGAAECSAAVAAMEPKGRA